LIAWRLDGIQAYSAMMLDRQRSMLSRFVLIPYLPLEAAMHILLVVAGPSLRRRMHIGELAESHGCSRRSFDRSMQAIKKITK